MVRRGCQAKCTAVMAKDEHPAAYEQCWDDPWLTSESAPARRFPLRSRRRYLEASSDHAARRAFFATAH